jgi:hypothetical protein
MLFLSVAILFVIVAFRNIDVGTDYLTYYRAINRVQTGTAYATDYEWLSVGFIGLIKLVAFLGIPSNYVPFVVCWIITALTLFFFYKAFIELSNYSTYSLFIFLSFCLYFQMMNQFRQMLAIAITLYAFKYINSSWFKYGLLIIVAGMFHSSALIMLPFYFIVKVKISRKIIILYFSVCIVVILFFSKFTGLLMKISYGATYLNWSTYNGTFTVSSLFNLLVRIILLIISLNVYNILKVQNEKKYQAIYHMIIVCTILQFFTVMSYIFGRMTTYFFVYYILLLPEVIDLYRLKISKNSKRIYDVLIYTLLFIYQIVYYFGQGAEAGGYAKYSLIFNNSAYWK